MCWTQVKRRVELSTDGSSRKPSSTSEGGTRTIQVLYGQDRALVTSTEGVIGQWKEHFKEFLELPNPPPW